MDFRAGPYITDLSFDHDGGVDALERFYSLPGLAHVLLKGQRGEIKDNRVKAGLHSVHRFGERMSVVRVEEDWEVEFLTHASHQGRELTGAEKLALALGRANQHRDLQLTRGRE